MSIGTEVNDRRGSGQGAVPRRSREVPASVSIRGKRLQVGVALALTACGGTSLSPPVTATVGPAGGSVGGPGGARVVIPPGALSTPTAITIEQTGAGAPPLPAGLTGVGPVFAFTPHGTTFAVPVTMTLPFNSASVPAGGTPELYKTNAQNQWERVAGATFGANSVSGSVTGFSFGQVVVPLQRFPPSRRWTFNELRGDALVSSLIPPDEAQPQTGGALFDLHDYGNASDLLEIELPANLAAEFPPDGRASGEVFSSESGTTYSAYTEAPIGNTGIPNDLIGSRTSLHQSQTFIKRATDATLTFTVSSIVLAGRDGNGILSRACPAHHGGLSCDLIKSEVTLIVTAVKKGEQQRFWGVRSGVALQGANVRGTSQAWDVTPWNSALSNVPLWAAGDFKGTFRTDPFGFPEIALVELVSPRTFSVDLSSVGVGETFTLNSTVFVKAYNRAGIAVAGKGNEFGTYAAAYLRDPQQTGGTVLSATGLEATAPEESVAGPEVPVVPAPCLPGPAPDPAAGVLQFGAPTFETAEGNTTPVVTVTRTGGSRGAVTATVRTRDGSARAGTDYAPLSTSVFFGDGDTAERSVEVLGLPNTVGGEAAKTVNLTLSEPGGCAALGSQSSTVLTLTDDDAPPPPPDPDSFLDPGFGTAGKVTTERFGGDDSAMVLQPDGKIVMVGGSTSDFVLARYNTDGSLDTSFGSGGKVTTDMIPGGIVQETARAVALQPDGKIVVVGDTRVGLPFAFALARYNTDGSLDASFGSGGKVTGGVGGRAFAVAVQPDGNLVVAGDDPVSGDFRLARFAAGGTLDAGFGTGGQVTTDLGGDANVARNVILLPNGKILVSGDIDISLDSSGLNPAHTDLVQYNANGSPDPSFGTGGKVTLSGKRVGLGLVRQSDGKLILAGDLFTGNVATGTTDFAVMRLNEGGTPDSTFGNAGFVSTDIEDANKDRANDVTLQPDGKILVAGSTGNVNADFALVRYTANGTLDSSFADAGKLTLDFFGSTDSAESVAVQPDGKVVLGGLARNIVDGYGLARVGP